MSSLNELDAPGAEAPGASMNNQSMFEVLVLGVGNVMMGDEGLGVQVARNLLQNFTFPPEVEVVDGGTGGLALLSYIRSARRVIVIDAIQAGAEPGSIFMFDSDQLEESNGVKTSVHDIGIIDVLNTAGLLDDRPPATIIGVQPGKMDEFGGGLSPKVGDKVDRVIQLVLDYLAEAGFSPRPKGACTPPGPE
ncbi:hydrogenase 2 maturation protease [bacterium BMS3Abin01]|nr:hydrogenase 2 maturation protease [bacterium BMS3Abin01]HDZ59499.1 hydrogenase maturation protease [Actinomycetota bacterium]